MHRIKNSRHGKKEGVHRKKEGSICRHKGGASGSRKSSGKERAENLLQFYRDTTGGPPPPDWTVNKKNAPPKFGSHSGA